MDDLYILFRAHLGQNKIFKSSVWVWLTLCVPYDVYIYVMAMKITVIPKSSKLPTFPEVKGQMDMRIVIYVKF